MIMIRNNNYIIWSVIFEYDRDMARTITTQLVLLRHHSYYRSVACTIATWLVLLQHGFYYCDAASSGMHAWATIKQTTIERQS